MIHKAWSNIEEVPYCISRASSNFEVTRDKKIANFYLNWAFPDCNFSLNLLMAIKWCTKLEATQKRHSIVFQGNPSNFKVTRDKKSPIFTRIERFRTVTLVWIHCWLWNNAQSLKQIEEVPCCFSRSSVKFQGHTGQKIADFDPNWEFPDCNSSFKSLMALKWCTKFYVV